jgi:outer membrane protein OmpA-like peptidoglycan-associated protein
MMLREYALACAGAVAAAFLGLAAPALAQQAEDCETCKDLPLLSRYPGSFLVGQEHREFDEVTVATGKYVETPEFTRVFETTRTFEGKVDKLFYHGPKGRSALEVYANYQEALGKAGFEILFSCKGEDGCGKNFSLGFEQANPLPAGTIVAAQGIPDAERPRYMLGRLKRDTGDIYVSLFAADLVQRDNAGIFITLIETKPMQTGMVVVDVSALDRALKDEGKVILYGVYFDFDSAVVKPESKAQLDQIAELLRKEPALKLLITGHTDNKGDFAYNMKLSTDRAAAVVAALVAGYGIDPSRLSSAGLGSTSPVASNDTEEGQAKNRRVELVRQ